MQEVPPRGRGQEEPSAVRLAATTPSALLQATDTSAVPALWGQAFPARTWRRVLGERGVVLTLERPGTLRAADSAQAHHLGPLSPGQHPLTPAQLAHDWLWVEGKDGETEDLGEVTWSLEGPLELPPVVVVIPTYRREADAVAQSRRFLAMDTVTAVIVVDQGGTLETHHGFAALQAEHPGLHLVSQENLGGSGGYARGLLEAAREHPSAAVLFSDDDAVLSAESLRRMLTFQALAPRPTVLGTPLFSADSPSRLLAHTEGVGARAFQWRPADRVRGGIDLADTTPAEWTFHSQREAADYTGWWGTLFPPGTAAELGLPAPLFLKWDDAEYGLRARAKGYDQAVLPGTAVHHPPWTAYRTQMTWTARVLHRNRLAVAAAYGAGRGVLASSLLHQAKHVLAGHLLTAELWEDGIDAVLAGPDAWLGRDLSHARDDGAAVAARWHRDHDLTDIPGGRRTGPLPFPRAALRAATRMLGPDRPASVVLEVPADEVHWRSTLGGDAIVITDAAGGVETAYAVPGSAMRTALARSLRSHLALARTWPALRESYGAALPRHLTERYWSSLFGTDSGDDEHEGRR